MSIPEKNFYQLSNKDDLPAGWIIKTSRKHPDRIFYFNVDSGEACWTLPTKESEKINNKQIKKRKSNIQETECNSSDYSSVEEEENYYGSLVDLNKNNGKKKILNVPQKNFSNPKSANKIQSACKKNTEEDILSDSSEKSVILCQSSRFKKNVNKRPKKKFLDESENENEEEKEEEMIPYSNILEHFGQGFTEITNLQVNAQTKISFLKKRSERNINFRLQNKKQGIKNDIDDNAAESRILKKIEKATINKPDVWEFDKVLLEVQNARFQKNINQLEKSQEQLNFKYVPFNINEIQDALYVVIDTNIFILNLELIKNIQKSVSLNFGKPILVIPWTVLQELFYLKTDQLKSQFLKLKANEAIDYLKKCFTAENTNFLVQSSADVEKNKEIYKIDYPNDEILQICLQIQELKTVALVTFDKSLLDAATKKDIKCLGKDDPLEKIDLWKLSDDGQEFILNSLHIQDDENKEIPDQNKEFSIANKIIEKGKYILTSFLSKIIRPEIEKLFGKKWEIHIHFKPPWSIEDLISLALKYWVIAYSQIFLTKGEILIKDVQNYISKMNISGYNLQETMLFLDKSLDFIQTVVDERYKKLRTESTNKLMNLRQECQNRINEINLKKFKDLIGQCIDDEEEKMKADYAISCFEEVYSFARDTCGLTAEKHGMHCSFFYNQSHPYLNISMVSDICNNVAASSVRLSQALGLALEKIKSAADVSASLIINVYDAVMYFSSEINFDKLENLAPLDIYCCIKWRKKLLTEGLYQFQELIMHFCRMASHKFT